MLNSDNTCQSAVSNLELRLLHASGLADTLSSHGELEEHLQLAFGAIEDLLTGALDELNELRQAINEQLGGEA